MTMDYGRAEMLVDGAWLQAHLGDPNLRIVDCDPVDAYRRAHIPGSVVPRDNRFKDPDNIRFVMKPAQFAAAMAELGISDDTDVVAYDASGSLNAGRLWWCLTYYGYTKARVLNGGWNRWLQEGRPMTMEETKVSAGKFTPRADESVYASAEYVMSVLETPGVVVLDVRTDGEWEGTNSRGNKRAGRMPGAVHSEWTNNLVPDAARCFKPASELKSMLDGLGVTPDQEIVTVCQGGIRAAQAAFTLRLMGFDRVRNYDGSFGDWANREDTPLLK
ncbi:MAG TPA: sulfurtransferase [Dehalococcoidia bacterium]|nr:sulfurtransferase [Dehalococcoidia bacterium]